MIPKVIHYCWFGGNPLTENIKQYIRTWKKFFPDYEIRQWNEKNFDLNSCQFVREAYQARKWAFVSDYVRLYVVYKYGGIYFDTDIEVRRDISDYLKKAKMLLGFESQTSVMTAFFAAEPENTFIKKLLDIYNNKPFILPDGRYDVAPNPILFTSELQKIGLVTNGKTQVFGDSYHIYPYEFFSAFNIDYQKFEITENTYIVHHCNGSWQSPNDKIKQKLKSIILKAIGKECFEKIKKRFYKNKR